jgi:hypothetical protein
VAFNALSQAFSNWEEGPIYEMSMGKSYVHSTSNTLRDLQQWQCISLKGKNCLWEIIADN